jgi:hypothetical protein
MKALKDHKDILIKLPISYLKTLDQMRGDFSRNELIRTQLLMPAGKPPRTYPEKVDKPEEGTQMRRLYDAVLDARREIATELTETDAPVEEYLPVKKMCGALRDLCEKIEELGEA